MSHVMPLAPEQIVITPDTVVESSSFICGADEGETRQFVREQVERLRERGVEITHVGAHYVSYRTTVGKAEAQGFEKQAIAAMLFSQLSAERTVYYYQDLADFFVDEETVYSYFGLDVPSWD